MSHRFTQNEGQWKNIITGPKSEDFIRVFVVNNEPEKVLINRIDLLKAQPLIPQGSRTFLASKYDKVESVSKAPIQRTVIVEDTKFQLKCLNLTMGLFMALKAISGRNDLFFVSAMHQLYNVAICLSKFVEEMRSQDQDIEIRARNRANKCFFDAIALYSLYCLKHGDATDKTECPHCSKEVYAFLMKPCCGILNQKGLGCKKSVHVGPDSCQRHVKMTMVELGIDIVLEGRTVLCRECSGDDAGVGPEQLKMMEMCKALMKQRGASIFHAPVDIKVYPTYLDAVKTPCDLGTILLRLRTGEEMSMEKFVTLAKRVFSNAILFNGNGSWIGELARSLDHKLSKLLKGESIEQTHADVMAEAIGGTTAFASSVTFKAPGGLTPKATKVAGSSMKKKKRGRPRKYPVGAVSTSAQTSGGLTSQSPSTSVPVIKRKRGRPRKDSLGPGSAAKDNSKENICNAFFNGASQPRPKRRAAARKSYAEFSPLSWPESHVGNRRVAGQVSPLRLNDGSCAGPELISAAQNLVSKMKNPELLEAVGVCHPGLVDQFREIMVSIRMVSNEIVRMDYLIEDIGANMNKRVLEVESRVLSDLQEVKDQIASLEFS